MAKKKKTQLKPVARGFATTSLPKKKVQETSPEDITTTLGQPSKSSNSGGSSATDKEQDEELHSHGTIPEKEAGGVSLVDQPLQNLVDKLQDKTEKEISRTLKSIEVDRRFSQTLPTLDIDPLLRDRILALALDSAKFEGQKITEESEEKATSRLGITYGLLRRLGFSETRVEECMRSISGTDLDEALDWLHLHCKEDELTPCPAETPDAKTLKIASGVSVRNHFTPPPTPRLLKDTSQRKPLVDDSTLSYIQTDGDFVDSLVTADNIPSNIKSRILASYASRDEDCEDSDQDDPVLAYTRLRLRLDEISLQPRSQETVVQVQHLQQDIDKITNDYLFNEKEAIARYQQERRNLEKHLLQERLQSSSSYSPKGRVKKPKALRPPSPPPVDKGDVFDNSDSDDSSTGMLGLLDSSESKEIVVKGVTYFLRQMEIPKHWSGPMPKILLRDCVAKVDRYAAISYTSLSKHSRAKRANVTISWHNRKRDEWSMDDVACPDDSQAEHYIATVALHSLIYPLTEGFAASSPISTSSSTSFRLLPPVYRDLWDELEASKKMKYDAINRAIWGKVQNMVEVKMQNSSKSSSKQPKPSADKQPPSVPRSIIESNQELSDPLSLSFSARQMTPAYQQMLARRNDLPIAQYRDRIIGILEQSQVLVLSGETGCGKSTQVPAFILEDQLAKGQHCKIYCTEPRRISAISLAQRVSYELCDPPSSLGTTNSLVGYSIRLESKISRGTRLAFVTNGIALRMLEGGSGQGGQGTAFDEITHLIIDEVHERTIESDFLLIVLKSLLVERPDLKVVLMSATVDAEKISSYFGNCQTLHVPGRTFPVNVQFLEDAIEYTKWSLTENSPYARRSHDKYYKGKNRPEWTEDALTIDDDDDDSNSHQNVKLEKRYSAETAITLNTIDERLIPYELIIRLLERICYEDQEYVAFSPAILIFMPGLGEIRRLNDLLVEHEIFGSNDFKIYPLHSSLSSENQGAIFDIPPPGVRKIVIATNIAETGITIPDITCVIDTGKHREMRFDEKRQISRLVETFIARSNAAQRRGRAGRVQNGLCFHLFTKMRHDTQMVDSPLPEMMRLSLSDLALRIKIMKIKLGSSIEDVLARAMDPPVSINVQRAVSMLVEVRALTPNEEITPMGRLLSKLPTDVHLGKFLLIATIFRCLDPALTIAATLNSKSPFVAPLGLEAEADRAKNSFRIENSDFLTIHNAFSSWRRACANAGFARQFSRTNFLSHQNLQQIEDLRQQFLGYLIDSSFVQVDRSIVRELSRARNVRNRTRFVVCPPELDVNSNNPLLVNAALAAGLYPKILSIDCKNGQMRTITNNQHAFFHPSSINFGRNVTEFGVNHLAYFTLMHSKRLYAWETGPVDDLCMLLLCGETDFKLASDMVTIDRKIKFSIPPKSAVALKILREQLTSLMAQQYQGMALTDVQAAWMDIGFLALSRIKLKAVEKEEILSAVK